MDYKKEGFLNQVGIVMPYEVRKILVDDPLTSMLYVTDIGYYPKAEKHYVARKNGALQHILIYCVSGSGWYMLGEEKHEVQSGQFFVIEKEVPHSYGASDADPWSIYWVHFTGVQSVFFADLFNRKHDLSIRKKLREKERIQLFRELFCNLERGYTLNNLRYATMCLWHLLGSFRYVEQFDEVASAELLDVVQLSINYMRANIDKRLLLKDIAGNAGYSPSHFGKIFAAKTNQTPSDYFNQMKIQAACQYLIFSSMKVKEIALKLGFYDQYHFSKVFFKYMNIPPSMYRSRKR